jgi:hypothetical protein
MPLPPILLSFEMACFTSESLLLDEEDLVAAARVALQAEGWNVFVARASQAAVWFRVGELRKAPDIVAVRGGYLLVLEAKVKTRQLFRAGSSGRADDQMMRWLSESETSQDDFKKRLERRLAPICRSELLQVCAGLLAGQDFTDEEQLKSKGLVLIVLKPHGLEWIAQPRPRPRGSLDV